jgi:AraC-like DNA-binding protein
MNASINFYLGCVAVAVCNLLLTAVLLVTLRREGNTVANRVLGGLLLCVAGSFGSDLLAATNFFDQYPHFFEYDAFLSLCIGPLMYYYILLQTRPDYQPGQGNALLHLLPIVLYGLILNDFFLSDSLAKRIAIQQFNLIRHYELAQYLKKGQILLYWLFSYRLLLRHNRVVEDVLSSPDNRRLTWVRHLLVAAAGLFAVWVVSNEFSSNGLLGVTLTGFSYWIAYQGLNQQPVFDNPTKYVFPILQQEPEVRYRNSTLTAADIEASRQRIGQHMAQAKPYLNPTLTLTNLADQLGIHANHLSQVLNEGFGENFYRFVNRHRIDESKRLLLDPAFAHYSISGIAEEAGFNAKSTFNKAFREMTGQSPSDFVKQQRAGSL